MNEPSQQFLINHIQHFSGSQPRQVVELSRLLKIVSAWTTWRGCQTEKKIIDSSLRENSKTFVLMQLLFHSCFDNERFLWWN